MIAIESPLQIVRSVGAQSENGCQANKPTDSYVEFEFVFPDMVWMTTKFCYLLEILAPSRFLIPRKKIFTTT
jgi:hypothetical protein